MPKTNFSKSELIHFKSVLFKNKMIPVDKIVMYHDPFNSGLNNEFNIIKFVKGKRQIDIAFVTRTVPNTDCLVKQLYKYFSVYPKGSDALWSMGESEWKEMYKD